MAAHLEGKGIVTQDSAGLAQKGGATWSHVLIAETAQEIRTTRVGTAAADLILGCDPLVTAGKETVLRMRAGRTRVALNGHGAPTAAFVKDGNWQNPAAQCVADITRAVGESGIGVFDADAVAGKLMGDTIFVNPMLLGYAWQKGWLPLRRESILRAMELNGVAVEANQAAFEWGRQAAHDGARVQALLTPLQTITFKPRETLDDIVARRVDYLTAYQNAAYAQSYQDFVARVRRAEEEMGAESKEEIGVGSEFRTGVLPEANDAVRNSALTPISGASGAQQPTNQKLPLTETVARNLFKLMAYKDEYEVARLHSDPAFRARIAGLFEGDFKLHYHLAPPLLAKRNDKGELIKRKYGPWMGRAFQLLAGLKGLRGSALDPFGHTEERRQERALIGDYRAAIEQLLAGYTPARKELALEVARLPEQIKGFGHVKARNLAVVRLRQIDLMARWHGEMAESP
jgi:indolepyruvate ferredoxin oxidoreductase